MLLFEVAQTTYLFSFCGLRVTNNDSDENNMPPQWMNHSEETMSYNL